MFGRERNIIEAATALDRDELISALAYLKEAGTKITGPVNNELLHLQEQCRTFASIVAEMNAAVEKRGGQVLAEQKAREAVAYFREHVQPSANRLELCFRDLE